MTPVAPNLGVRVHLILIMMCSVAILVVYIDRTKIIWSIGPRRTRRVLSYSCRPKIIYKSCVIWVVGNSTSYDIYHICVAGYMFSQMLITRVVCMQAII